MRLLAQPRFAAPDGIEGTDGVTSNKLYGGYSVCPRNSCPRNSPETPCGNAFNVEVGTPRENGMMFCCYSGKHLDQRRHIPMMDEEEPEAMNVG